MEALDLSKRLSIAPEVQEALAANQPVVALESTIISHGMPFSENMETALKVEAAIREEGAIPATVAILDGKVVVGCSDTEIERVAVKGLEVIKTSRRDYPFVLAAGLEGATTVSGTMIAAKAAGIRFFATGGCGGVHRHAEVTMDISADLEELARTEVMVIASGVKSILDIGLTLEYLETKGVPVVGFQTEEMPAFYTRKSGLKVPSHVNSVEELAKLWKAKEEFGLGGGMLVANPIPEKDSVDPEYIEMKIADAIDEAKLRGIHGKDLTPFLLDMIQTTTSGLSLEANVALVINNARVAARTAIAYSKLG